MFEADSVLVFGDERLPSAPPVTVECALCGGTVTHPEYAHAWADGIAHGVCIIEWGHVIDIGGEG